MNDKFYVYMHVNTVNGKRYIGITRDCEKRWRNGSGYYKNKHFNDAIKKYGWDAFDHIVLYWNLSKEDACQLEKDLISFFDTQDKRYGYNLTNGGEHFKHSEESKQLMSERKKGQKLPPFTEEHIRKLKDNHSGGTDKKPVRCIETGEIFESINAAAKAVNKSKLVISKCCRKFEHYLTAGGYHWEFLSNEE